ncbi:hypothetical protein A1O7_01532 [Cladophialophora yegresii CBS 114405]|uniref:F-box domain-containing protein n=1 Tax=Cladophialophora yegresii CBS 114405 TaxID=1182544 RepID=W9WAQ2_9EURO|nr:uncharacterized protein A1O7_01532 [Cladophialophora yegresii CBS 114405]EXJ65192.1 hypothetical protein A1O7_01532 [Cladophialophora yegresii CBS 114405]
MEGRWSSASTSTSTSTSLQRWHLPSDQSASTSTTSPLTLPSWTGGLLPTALTQQQPPTRAEIARFSESTIYPVQRRQQLTPDVPPLSDPYDPFFIPQSILSAAPVSPQFQPTSKILQLPPEILTLIFEKVKIPYFQISLALTCKTMARIASQKNVMSPWRGYRDKDGLFRLLERKNNKWMPSSLGLCRACFMFRPRDIAFWEKELESPEFDCIYANWYDIFGWFDQSYQQHRCPWCTILGYTAYFREAQLIEDREKGPRTRTQSTCPRLARRIDRP